MIPTGPLPTDTGNVTVVPTIVPTGNVTVMPTGVPSGNPKQIPAAGSTVFIGEYGLDLTPIGIADGTTRVLNLAYVTGTTLVVDGGYLAV